MKVGINILNFGPGTDPDALRSWTTFAERAGFSLAMLSDHVALTEDVDALYPAPFYEPFSTLAWLAGVTDRLELGTTVAIVPYRNPILTAQMAANIDRFSNGRFVFGVGVGWSEPEFAALGVPFERRGAITDEYLAAVKELWTSDLASKEGEFVRFSDLRTGPRPRRGPHPPIWVGGSSRAALRRAVTYGDAWHPINPRPGWVRAEGVVALGAVAARAGREVPRLCPRTRIRLTTSPLDDADRLTGEGTLTQVLGDIEDFADLGSDYVVLDPYLGPEQRRSPEEDWRTLETVVTALFKAGIATPAQG